MRGLGRGLFLAALTAALGGAVFGGYQLHVRRLHARSVANMESAVPLVHRLVKGGRRPFRTWGGSLIVSDTGRFFGAGCYDPVLRTVGFGRDDRPAILDAWGHPIRFKAPGPIHVAGWDLWSFGPNGLNDNGRGDDIVVGEDLAGQ